MSNTEAANVYADIIEDVIAESRQDFENSGIDEATLQDLRKIWMEKLVLSQVADFPWAPQSKEDADALENSNSLALHAAGYTPPESQASNTISDLTTGGGTGLEYPSITETAKPEDSGLVLPTGGRIVNQGDGNFELTIDFEKKTEALRYMRDLKRRNRKKIIVRQADGLDSDSNDDDADDDDKESGDGFGSDDINSDLDDSDSLESEDDSDEQEGNIMLCLYDKVQRVKNKWKCNLKEGVASLNGKDYTFQKASSESEW